MTTTPSVSEINTFVRGLITEASPLTFPENAGLFYENIIPRTEGSNKRRLGMDFEAGFSTIVTDVVPPVDGEIAQSDFVWENAGGDVSLSVVVVQVGNQLFFFRGKTFPLSANLLKTQTFTVTGTRTVFDYTVIDGLLIVTTGQKEINTFIFDPDTEIITRTQATLKIRDLFGLEDIVSGEDLRLGNGVSKRPGSLSTPHQYNLRNQGWGISRPNQGAEALSDPILAFFNESDDPVVTIPRGSIYRNQPNGDFRIFVSDSGLNFPFTKEREPSAQDGGPVPGTVYVEDFAAGFYVFVEGGDLDFRDTPPEGGDPDVTEPVQDGEFLFLSGGFWSLFEEIPQSGNPTSFLYPSNADTVIQALFPDATDTDNRTLNRFFPEDLIKSPLGNAAAARGHFVIDAMQRGQSRVEELIKMQEKFPQLFFQTTTNLIPLDKTEGGPKVVTEFAGRAWFAGFPAEVTEGDSKSPRLSSYVMFSRLVKDVTDITACHQESDPTSEENSDLVATDGGFIRLDGAFDIKGMVNVGVSLIVFAANGVWSITGGSDFGFSATDFLVNKITNHGVVTGRSVVVVDNSVFYWSDDGIYLLNSDKFGDHQVQNISKPTIQTLFDSIDNDDKLYIQGAYDHFERRVRWVYNNRIEDTKNVREIVFDVELGAFFTNRLCEPAGSDFPKVVSVFETTPYQLFDTDDPVVFEGGEVQFTGIPVTVGTTIQLGTPRELYYMVVTSVTPTIQFTFSLYQDVDWIDWKSFNGTGCDAEASFITGWNGGGDFQRNKRTLYLTVHTRRTEDPVVRDSSVLIRAMWEWSNSIDSGRWGDEFEAYRYSDLFKDGRDTVVSKNKLRGKGRVLSMQFKSSPGKEFYVYGWSMRDDMNNAV